MQCRRPPNGDAGAPADAYLGAAGGDALTPLYSSHQGYGDRAGMLTPSNMSI
jgi:hypothetical protein